MNEPSIKNKLTKNLSLIPVLRNEKENGKKLNAELQRIGKNKIVQIHPR